MGEGETSSLTLGLGKTQGSVSLTKLSDWKVTSGVGDLTQW